VLGCMAVLGGVAVLACVAVLGCVTVLPSFVCFLGGLDGPVAQLEGIGLLSYEIGLFPSILFGHLTTMTILHSSGRANADL